MILHFGAYFLNSAKLKSTSILIALLYSNTGIDDSIFTLENVETCDVYVSLKNLKQQIKILAKMSNSWLIFTKTNKPLKR